eukprot:6492789-Amphidinium_carterae.2
MSVVLPTCLDIGVCPRNAYRKRSVPGDGNCFWHALAEHTGRAWRDIKALVLQEPSQHEIHKLAEVLTCTEGAIEAELERCACSNAWADTLCVYLASMRLGAHLVVVRPGSVAYAFVSSEAQPQFIALELHKDHYSPIIGVDCELMRGGCPATPPKLHGGAEIGTCTWAEHCAWKPSCRLAMWNINSHNTNLHRALQVNADIIGLVEMKHAEEDVPTLRSHAVAQGWHGQFSDSTRGSRGRLRAGTAIFARAGEPENVPLPESLQCHAKRGRLQVCWRPTVLGVPMLVALVYGYLRDDGMNLNQARDATRGMLRELDDFLQGYRQHGVCLMGDFNLDDDDSMVDWLRYDAEWYHAVNDLHTTNSVSTCHVRADGNCIDHVMLNQNLWRMCTSAHVVRQSGIHPHDPVVCEFCPDPMKSEVVTLPTQFPRYGTGPYWLSATAKGGYPGMPKRAVVAADARLRQWAETRLEIWRNRWRSCLINDDCRGALCAFSDQWEEFLSVRHTTQGKTGRFRARPSRGVCGHPVRMLMSQRERTVQDALGVVQDLCNDGCVTLADLPGTERKRLHLVLRKIVPRSFYDGCDADELPLKVLLDRRAEWRRRLAEKPYGAAYGAVRPRRPAPLAQLVVGGERITGADGLLEALASAWGELAAAGGVPAEELLADVHVQDCLSEIASMPCSWDYLTGADVYAALGHLKSHSACGPDGWRAHELKQLPLEFSVDMAELFNQLEWMPNGWNCGLNEVWNVPIPKVAEDGTVVSSLHPLKIRPISLTPIMHRVWGRARMKQLEPWFDMHLASSQAAYRARRGPLSEATKLAHTLESRGEGVWYGVKN